MAMANCRRCHGRKIEPGSDGWTCEICGGTGKDPDISLEELSSVVDDDFYDSPPFDGPCCCDCGEEAVTEDEKEYLKKHLHLCKSCFNSLPEPNEDSSYHFGGPRG